MGKCCVSKVNEGNCLAGVKLEAARDEWFAVLSAAEAPNNDGLTAKEWSVRLAMSADKASAWIRSGMEAGFMQRVSVRRSSISGYERTIPGFAVVEAKA